MQNDMLSKQELDDILKNFNFKKYGLYDVSGFVLPDGYFSVNIKGRTLGVKESSIVFSKICEKLMLVQRHVILNLRNCSYFSSLALGAIAKLASHRKDLGIKIILVQANDLIEEVIKISGLDKYIYLCESEEEAVALLNSLDPNFSADAS